jgi:hypothetical protein
VTAEQEQLSAYMSELSEHYYCAGWLNDLEYTLWAMICGDSKSFGLGHVREAELAELTRLALQCGGWIYFDDETWETYIPLAEWMRRYRDKMHGALQSRRDAYVANESFTVEELEAIRRITAHIEPGSLTDLCGCMAEAPERIMHLRADIRAAIAPEIQAEQQRVAALSAALEAQHG